ncbi:hypothetical protein B0H19DRAFT_926677, partial [Mycena capillaripes]
RLDEVHFALREYLEDKISFAPICATSPAKILELGCGSGAWSVSLSNPNGFVRVENACLGPSMLPMTFPDVEVDFPFEQATFDVVHARLLFIHVPHATGVIECVENLVRPGGWLVLEDLDLSSTIEGAGPGVKGFIIRWNRILEERGADGDIGKKMEGPPDL